MSTSDPSSLRQGRWSGKLAVGLLVALALLACAELLARQLAGVPQPTLVARMPDGSDELFQRQEGQLLPRYQKDFAQPIPLQASPDERRVVWLGGSSIWSGESKDALAQAAPTAVGRALGVTTVNLGGPGLDTGHLVALLPEVLELAPDAVVIYTGHNDLGNAVFFNRYGDAEHALIARARAQLGRLRLFQLLEALFSRQVFVLPMPDNRGSFTLDAAQRARVNLHLYERLGRIVRSLHTAQIPVVLATVVSNPVAPSLEWRCPAQLRRLGGLGNARDVVSVDHISLDDVEQALHMRPDCADLKWLHARLLADQGDRQAGMQALDQLRDSDPLPLRATRSSVSAIRLVAWEEGARLADAAAVFRQAGGGLEPPAWFRDSVHLSTLGNQALAAVIAPELAQALDLPFPDLALPAVDATHFSWCESSGCRKRSRVDP